MVEVVKYITSELRLSDSNRVYKKDDIIEIRTKSKPNVWYLGRIEQITLEDVYLDMSSRFKIRVEIIPINDIDEIKIFGYYREK